MNPDAVASACFGAAFAVACFIICCVELMQMLKRQPWSHRMMWMALAIVMGLMAARCAEMAVRRLHLWDLPRIGDGYMASGTDLEKRS